MTYNEFKNKYLGKELDFDGSYGMQCWDLAEYYITECIGLPASIIAGLPTGIVSDLLVEPKLSLMKKYFDIIPLNQKQAGDIEVFDWGHIAIMDHWDNTNKVNIYLTQNSGTADKPVGGVYLGAIADNPKCMAFRKKVEVTIDYKAKYNEELIKNASLNTEIAKLNLEIQTDKAKIDNLTNLVSTNDSEILSLKQENIKLEEQIEALDKEIADKEVQYKIELDKKDKIISEKDLLIANLKKEDYHYIIKFGTLALYYKVFDKEE